MGKSLRNIEKRNYTNKNISSLVDNQGKDITEQKQILETVKDFYQKLVCK